MREHHYLKCETHYFQSVEKGTKKFEVRKNDRNFKVCDVVHLQETVDGILTGSELPPLEIQYIFRGGKYGLDEDYCIFCW